MLTKEDLEKAHIHAQKLIAEAKENPQKRIEILKDAGVLTADGRLKSGYEKVFNLKL